MKVEKIIEQFRQALSNLSFLEEIKDEAIVVKICDESEFQRRRYAYFLNDCIYHDDDICKIVDDLIDCIKDINYINIDEFEEIYPYIQKVCHVLNRFGENKVKQGQLSFKVLLSKDDGGLFVRDVRTAVSQRRILLEALEDIDIVGDNEYKQDIKIANERLNQLKIEVLETLIYQKSFKEFEFFTGEDNLCVYNMVSRDFESGTISNCICKILQDPDCFVANYSKFRIKKLMKIKNAPKAYVEKFELALKKRYGIMGKIENLMSFLKSEKINVFKSVAGMNELKFELSEECKSFVSEDIVEFNKNEKVDTNSDELNFIEKYNEVDIN